MTGAPSVARPGAVSIFGRVLGLTVAFGGTIVVSWVGVHGLCASIGAASVNTFRRAAPG